MNDVRSLIAGLVKDPGLLANLVKDPQSIVRLAQLADTNQKARQEIGRMVANLTTRLAAPPARQAALTEVSSARPGNGQALAGESQTVALTGVLALAAIAGGVTVVGVVSIVALSTSPERLQA